MWGKLRNGNPAGNPLKSAGHVCNQANGRGMKSDRNMRIHTMMLYDGPSIPPDWENVQQALQTFFMTLQRPLYLHSWFMPIILDSARVLMADMSAVPVPFCWCRNCSSFSGNPPGKKCRPQSGDEFMAKMTKFVGKTRLRNIGQPMPSFYHFIP